VTTNAMTESCPNNRTVLYGESVYLAEREANEHNPCTSDMGNSLPHKPGALCLQATWTARRKYISHKGCSFSSGREVRKISGDDLSPAAQEPHQGHGEPKNEHHERAADALLRPLDNDNWSAARGLCARQHASDGKDPLPGKHNEHGRPTLQKSTSL